jgi:uncharacterized protein YdhG (YjbR/CyaY superfamily)
MKQTKTVDEYLASVPEAARITLEKVRQRIRAAVPPGSTEGLSYGMPAFRHEGKALAAYAAFKNHCSLFPMSGAVFAQLTDELKPYKTSKGTLQFPIGKPLSAALIKKIVKVRLAELAAKKQRG